MRVVVVGGGVVGLCVAEALARHGAEVVLFEAGAIGGGVSAGNAGWITPSHAAPLPTPGTMAQALRWMVNPRSPLLVRPIPSPSFGRWLLDFGSHTRRRPYRAGLAAMVALAARALSDYDALAARCSFEMHSQGLLYVGRSQRAIEEELELRRDQQTLGYSDGLIIMDRDQVLAHEPALRPDVAGAILATEDRHVRPETLTRALAALLRAAGVDVRDQTAVAGISPAGGRWLLECDQGSVMADRVVLAGGIATARLLRPLGVRLPLVGAKGYSVTVQEPPLALRGPIYLLEARVGISPFEGAVRLAETLELGSRGADINRGRVAAIERAAKRSLRDWTGDLSGRQWAGFRPLLPDGLPAIGPVPGREGLHVATGHGMLGVTLAPTTAELLAPAVLEGKPPLALAPFSIARFGN